MKNVLITLSMFIFLSSFVLAITGIPNQFYGDVTVNGAPAPDGIRVDAKLGSLIFSTVTSEGTYGINSVFMVLGDDPETSEIEGGVNGDTIQFYLNDVLAGSASFENGKSIENQLSANGVTIPTPPTPPATTNPPATGGSGGGGGGSGGAVKKTNTSVSNTSASSAAASATTTETSQTTANPESPPPAPNEQKEPEKTATTPTPEGITGAAVTSTGRPNTLIGAIIIISIIIIGVVLYFIFFRK